MASKLEKLNLSNDELDRFKKAMDDPEFRNLLRDYTDEISDPKNRAEHEAYLREVEERAKGDAKAQQEGDYSNVVGGMNIPKGSKLVSPHPVFCLKVIIPENAKRKKTTAKKDEPAAAPAATINKIFINLCTADAMDDISAKKAQSGQQFSLPYSLSPARETKDTHGAVAKVYDFVFSDATWKQYCNHMRVVSMFQDMAIEAVEEREGLTIGTVDKKDGVVILKNTTFKGGKPPPRLFKVSEEKWKEQQKQQPKPSQTQTAPAQSATQSKKPVEETKTNAADDLKQISSKTTAKPSNEPKADPRQTPKYTITHRGYYDFTAGQMSLSNEQTSRLSELLKTRPKELIVKIELPQIDKVSEVNLDQSPHQLLLSSATYFLLLPLPYPVLDEQGRASWSSKQKTLTVTMVVGQPSQEEIDRYLNQRKGYDEKVKSKQEEEEKEKAEEERKEKERIEEEYQTKLRKEREEQEEEREKERKRKEELAHAAAAEQRRIESEKQQQSQLSRPTSTSPSSNTPSPSLTSVLKSSLSPHGSPSQTGQNGSGSDKRVRFSFSDAESVAGIPERDGPSGPKPVNKILVEEVSPSSNKPPPKGHKKKHIPGTEGPETWTGVGKEPSKEIVAHFPPLSPDVTVSPSNSANSPTGGSKKQQSASSAWLWPSYTYSQSAVSVVLVIKIKSIQSDSVKLNVQDSSITTIDGVTEPRTLVDLTFSTSSPKKHYRLFLPLASPINTTKTNFDCTSKNLILNLIKLPNQGEWPHLLDYRLLGEFDSDGTPLSSPAASPLVKHINAHHLASTMADLSLGVSQHEHDAADSPNPVNEAAQEKSLSQSTTAPTVTMEPISLTSSTMLNPLVATMTTSHPTTTSLVTSTTTPANSLLFQLD